MSLASPTPQGAPHGARSSRPQRRVGLRLVPRPRVAAPRVPFVVLLALLLLGGIGGLLMFNTSMQQSSFTASSLQARAVALEARQQTLQMRIERLRDPQRVGLEARKLGMVPASPAFLRLRDGKVLGDPRQATSADGLRITPMPAAVPADLRPKTRWVRPTEESSGSRAPSTGSADEAGTKKHQGGGARERGDG